MRARETARSIFNVKVKPCLAVVGVGVCACVLVSGECGACARGARSTDLGQARLESARPGARCACTGRRARAAVGEGGGERLLIAERQAASGKHTHSQGPRATLGKAIFYSERCYTRQA